MVKRSLWWLLLAGQLVSLAHAQIHAPPHGATQLLASQAGSGVMTNGKVLLVDLDGDGGPLEIVVGTNLGRLYVFDHHGNVRPGWAGGKQLPSEVGSSPAAGQLTGDARLEIVVGCGSAVPGEEEGQVTAFDADGTVLWEFDPLDGMAPTGPDGVFSTPALGDLDGDGLDDVAFGSFDFRVYALKGTDGSILPGWPYYIRESIWSSPALADLDGDGNLEVIIGSDVQAEGPPHNTPVGGGLWVYRKDGTLFPGFPKFVTFPGNPNPVGIQSSPVVGDVTGDGCPDIVVGTGLPRWEDPSVGKTLHVYQRDGSIPAGWPQTLLGHVVGSPALANLDGDTALEIVAPVVTFTAPGAFVAPSEGRVYAFNGDGTPVFSPLRPKTVTGLDADAIAEVAIAQVGVDNPVILAGSIGFDVALISKTGVQLSENGPPFPPTDPNKLQYTTQRQVAGPGVGDLDDNGTLVIVGASGRDVLDPDDLGIWAWNAGAVGALPWPQFRQNARRTGTAPGTVGCPVTPPPLAFYPRTPCRLSDSRQAGNAVYGGPKLVNEEQRTITFHPHSSHPSCDVPATARAVAINVTVTEATRAGLLRLFPGGDGVPSSTTLNFKAGQTRANNAVMPLSFDGRGNLTVKVELGGAGEVHVILDIFGYFE